MAPCRPFSAPTAASRGTCRTRPHERGYTVLSVWTWANTRAELRDRLLKRELAVYFETATDLRDAVRQAARADLSACVAEREKLARKWVTKRRTKVGAMFRVNRAFVLAGDPQCAYCPAPATSADHVIPQVQGGTHHRWNLVPACGPCNSEKNGRTVVQWQEWCARLGISWPPDHSEPRRVPRRYYR